MFLQKIISTFTFIALNVLAIAYFIFRGSFEGVYLRVLMTIFAFAVTFILLTIVFLYSEKKFSKFLKIIPLKESWKESLNQFLDNLRIYIKKIIKNPDMLKEQLIISLSIWTLFALKAYLIVNAFALEMNFIEAALLTYLSYMAGMIPLLPGGIGSVETAVVFFLAPFGATASTALAVALILRFATFWFVFLLSAIYVLFTESASLIKSFGTI